MPALTNARYEAVARGLATGRSATDAYAAAGYRRNRSHASRLVANGNIRNRVTELQQEIALEIISNEAIDTLAEMHRLRELVKMAAFAGDFRSALEGQKFLISCFGYADNPTMTHDHMTAKGMARENAASSNEDHFAKIIRELEARQSESRCVEREDGTAEASSTSKLQQLRTQRKRGLMPL